jgi:hypothetical protein
MTMASLPPSISRGAEGGRVQGSQPAHNGPEDRRRTVLARLIHGGLDFGLADVA